MPVIQSEIEAYRPRFGATGSELCAFVIRRIVARRLGEFFPRPAAARSGDARRAAGGRRTHLHARCRLQGHGDTPTVRELQVAALAIAQRLGVTESLPITSLLANDCEEQGLLVIRPVPTPPSSRRSSAPPLRRAS